MSASQNQASGGPQPPFSTRGALILLLATCCGVGVGVLTFMARKSLPEAILAGLSAVGGAAVAFSTLIGP
jgi:hypothetical protein